MAQVKVMNACGGAEKMSPNTGSKSLTLLLTLAGESTRLYIQPPPPSSNSLNLPQTQER